MIQINTHDLHTSGHVIISSRPTSSLFFPGLSHFITHRCSHSRPQTLTSKSNSSKAKQNKTRSNAWPVTTSAPIKSNIRPVIGQNSPVPFRPVPPILVSVPVIALATNTWSPPHTTRVAGDLPPPPLTADSRIRRPLPSAP